MAVPRTDEQRVVVLKAGAASAGKSTVAWALVQRLGVKLPVHVDDLRRDHSGAVHH